MVEEDITREVDEAVRHDRMVKLWRDIRKPLLLMSVFLVAGTAGGSIWKEQMRAQNAAFTQDMFAAKRLYDDKKYADAVTAFADIASAQSNEKKQIALVWQGRAEQKNDASDAAQKTLLSALSVKGGTLLWHDMACIDLIGIMDTAPEECAGSPESPLAPELQSAHAAALWQQGKWDEAVAMFNTMLQSPATPPALKDQIEEWKRTIEAQRADAAAPKKAK
jgi:hypothetical protein